MCERERILRIIFFFFLQNTQIVDGLHGSEHTVGQWLFSVNHESLVGGVLNRSHHLKSYRTFFASLQYDPYIQRATREWRPQCAVWVDTGIPCSSAASCNLSIHLTLCAVASCLAPQLHLLHVGIQREDSGKWESRERKHSSLLQSFRAGHVLCASIFSHISFPWHQLFLSLKTNSLFLSYADIFSFL